MNDRVARCYLLAEVLAADGMMSDDERTLLEQHLANHGLSEEERDRVRHFEGGEDAIAVLRQRTATERQEFVEELIKAAIADGKLTTQETAVVTRIARSLGLDE